MSESIAVAGAPPQPAALLQPDLLARLKRLRLGAVFIAGVVLLVVVVLAALLAPLLTPYDPIVQNLADAFQREFGAPDTDPTL